MNIQLLLHPHRVFFLCGVATFFVVTLSWALQLWVSLGPSLLGPAGWLHAWSMVNAALPPFFFAFLLTTFPQWLGQDPIRGPCRSLAAAWFVGVVCSLLGYYHSHLVAIVGMLILCGTWLLVIGMLWLLAWRAQKNVIHAWVALLGLGCGGLAQVVATVWIWHGDAQWFFFATRIAVWACLLPVFCAVCHRMIPFFTRCVLADTVLRRPALSLLLQTVAALVHVLLEARHAYSWLLLPDGLIFVVACWHVWAWWPRARARRGLLWVLHIGHLWLPIALVLWMAQSAYFAYSGQFILGRAPVHVLTLGFMGSLLIAMVTRVSQGHSGRPLIMPAAAWLAFLAFQAATLLRVAAELAMPWLNQLAIVVLMAALLPWSVRIAWIVLTPRADGKPG